MLGRRLPDFMIIWALFLNERIMTLVVRKGLCWEMGLNVHADNQFQQPVGRFATELAHL